MYAWLLVLVCMVLFTLELSTVRGWHLSPWCWNLESRKDDIVACETKGLLTNRSCLPHSPFHNWSVCDHGSIRNRTKGQEVYNAQRDLEEPQLSRARTGNYQRSHHSPPPNQGEISSQDGYAIKLCTCSMIRMISWTLAAKNMTWAPSLPHS